MGLKTSILFGSIILSTQLYASSLQTANSVNHTTPKVVWQDELNTVSQSVEIDPYGKLVDLNNRSYVFLSHYPASQARHPFIDEGEFLESVSSNSPNEGIDFEQNPFIYGSGYHDTESGLEYMGARYYSADIGRFVAQDSFDLLNRYNYGNANPIMTVDPDGHLAWGLLPDTWVGTIGMIAGIVAGGVIAGVIGGSLTRGYAIFSGVAAGAASGMAGDLVNQGFDRGWGGIQWQEAGFSAFVGGVLGAITGGVLAKNDMGIESSESRYNKMVEEYNNMVKKYKDIRDRQTEILQEKQRLLNNYREEKTRVEKIYAKQRKNTQMSKNIFAATKPFEESTLKGICADINKLEKMLDENEIQMNTIPDRLSALDAKMKGAI